MKTFKFGDKELKVKFAYEPTIKSHIISRMAKMENKVGDSADGIEAVEELLLLIPEMLLIGLQKYHKDEFAYDYETGEGKDEVLGKVFALMDDYTDNEDNEDGGDLMSLYQSLTEEMMNNSFLSSLLNKERSKRKTAKK